MNEKYVFHTVDDMVKHIESREGGNLTILAFFRDKEIRRIVDTLEAIPNHNSRGNT